MDLKLIKTVTLVSFLFFTLLILNIYGQENPDNWSAIEKEMYQNLKSLAYYTTDHKLDEIFNDTILNRYIVDYDRNSERTKFINDSFIYFKKTIDSIGIENLDAKPIRFYKNFEIYAPFKKEQMEEYAPYTFAYYNKKNPEKPIGSLLFSRESHKLVAWILLRLGDHNYMFLPGY